MVRYVLMLFALVWCVSPVAEAGWLSDKLKEAAQDIADKAINDGSDSAYEGAKRSVKDAVDSDGRPEAGEDPSSSRREEPQTQSTREDERAEMEEMLRSQRHQAEDGVASPSRASQAQRPPRTDLHFAADAFMVDRDSSVKEGRGKMYVDGESLRMEMQDPESGKPMVTILNAQAQKFLLLMPAEKTFMEYPMAQADGADDWRSSLSAEPCDGYRMADERGNATHDGRRVVEWYCEDPEDAEDPDTVTLWFDAKLKIPMRSEDSDGNRFEFRNLKEGKQPASLFAVPGGYTRMNLWGGGSAGRESSNPYAPKVEPVPGTENTLGGMVLANAVVPDADTVGIPAYPGARVLQTQNKPMMEGATNHIVVLLTTDPEDQVLSFFRRKLTGWKEEKIMGMTPVFHQGSGDINWFTASGQSVQNVMVETIIESMKYEVMPQAQTKITVGYHPKR